MFKLFFQHLVDEEFIFCLDFDFLPYKIYDPSNKIEFCKIKVTHHLGYWKGVSYFNKYFKYNCGLIGIPKSEAEFFRNVYRYHNKELNYPSY